MNTIEDYQKKQFIVLGGCHIAGFGIKENPSFIDIVENTLRIQCIFKKSQFQLQHIERLRYVLEHFQSDIVILQLGNNEFNASLKEIFHRLRNQNKSSNLISKIRKKSINSNNTFQKQSLLYFSLISSLKLALMPYIWRLEKKKNRKYLLSLQQIIQKNTDKTFVVMSPFPCYHTPDIITRRKAGLLFYHLFSLPNVILFDSCKQFPIKKEMFFDRLHLNAKGHELLGMLLCKKLIMELQK